MYILCSYSRAEEGDPVLYIHSASHILIGVPLFCFLKSCIELDRVLQAFAITVVLLCLNGYFLVQMRILLTTGSRVQFNETGDGIQFPQSAIDQIFAGAFIEVFFMVSCYTYIRIGVYSLT